MNEKSSPIPLDIKELVDNPNKFGLPTFEQYCKNRDYFQELFYGRPDSILATVDVGASDRKNIAKHVYELNGYRCNSLEEIERVAKGEGIPLKSLDIKPEMRQLGGGKYEILVRFVAKPGTNILRD